VPRKTARAQRESEPTESRQVLRSPSRFDARWLVPLAAVVLIGAVVAYRLSGPPEPQPDRWEIPRTDMRDLRGPVERALDAAYNALRDNRDAPDAWGKYAMILDAHELYDLASVAYRNARTLAPDEVRWAYYLAVVDDLRGAGLDEVMAAFHDAIELKPDDPAIRYRYAESLIRRGDLEGAREVLEDLVARSPGMPAAQRGLGQVLMGLEDPRSAIVHLERAVELEPDVEINLVALARAHSMLGDDDRANRALERSKSAKAKRRLDDRLRYEVERRAVDPDALITRAQANMMRGKLVEAIPDFALFLESAPDHAVAHFLLGMCLMQTGQENLAVEHLSAAVRLQDDIVDAHVNLAEVLVKRGDRAKALEHFRRALVHRPDHEYLITRIRELEGTNR
jgi:tetratricopeptide (TPR) repeat protein